MNETVVSVDPRLAPDHAAFYLRGIMDRSEISELPLTTDGYPTSYSDNKPLAFILRRGNAVRNIYIAADDMPDIDPAALEWCDVYGKVNLLQEVVPTAGRTKVVPIGPSHGVRIWNVAESLNMAWRTERAGGRTLGRRDHYRNYVVLHRRRVGDAYYEPQASEQRYVFYNSWLWAKHTEANAPRAEFVQACRELRSEIDFEGGFIARRRNDMPGYDDLLADRKYPLPEYLTNIKRSAVVFNNPAVHLCHGWKLGEFLRLGKAIVSTPLSREMPAPFLHGEHAHFVDGTRESMKEAVLKVVSDLPYRRHLERSAREYYVQHLAPTRVVGRLADLAFDAA